MTRTNNYFVIIGRDGNRPVSKWSVDQDDSNGDEYVGVFEIHPTASRRGSSEVTNRLLLEEPDAVLVE